MSQYPSIPEKITIELNKSFIEKLLLRHIHSHSLAMKILTSSNNLGALIQDIIETNDEQNIKEISPQVAYNALPLSNNNSELLIQKNSVEQKSEHRIFSFNPQKCIYTLNF